MTRAFERLLGDLSEAEVDYILVGGLAVAFCEHVRATRTSWFRSTTKISLGFWRFLPTLERDRQLSFNQRTSPLKKEPFASSTQRVDDHTTRPLNIEGLITLTEESLRQKDQIEVMALRRIREEQGG